MRSRADERRTLKGTASHKGTRTCERLHLQYIKENNQHSGIIIVPQKNPYELAKRISILVRSLTAEEINNQLLYA